MLAALFHFIHDSYLAIKTDWNPVTKEVYQYWKF